MPHERTAEQFKRPRGLRGLFTARKMEQGNAVAYDWVLPQVSLKANDKFLEIGYGTGLSLKVLAEKYPSVNFFGADFSRLMFGMAKRKNRRFIREGRMHLVFGDILDYPEKNFDAALAINVIYFWDDLPKHLAKVRSLIKPGGKFYIYMSSAELLNKIEITNNQVFNKYSLEYVLKELKLAGFGHSNVEKKTIPLGEMCFLTAF